MNNRNDYDGGAHCHICGYSLSAADGERHKAYCADFQRLENRYDRRNVLHMDDILNNEALYEQHRRMNTPSRWAGYATYYVRAQFARSILKELARHGAKEIMKTHLPFWKFRDAYLKSAEAKRFFGEELIKEIKKEYWGY
jgi:hypothetical protein